jgi:hypothetical protein
LTSDDREWEESPHPGAGLGKPAAPVRVPFSEFEAINNCLMRPTGCERVDWVREEFGDPVEITQRFIREAFRRYRGEGPCSLLDRHVPAAIRAEHLAYVQAAKAEYRDAMVRAENALVETGDVAAFDQAVALAFCRFRGRRYGALEGAFTSRFDPYF